MDRTVCSPPHLYGKVELRLVVGWVPSRQPFHWRLVLVPAPRRHSSPYSLTHSTCQSHLIRLLHRHSRLVWQPLRHRAVQLDDRQGVSYAETGGVGGGDTGPRYYSHIEQQPWLHEFPELGVSYAHTRTRYGSLLTGEMGRTVFPPILPS